MSDDKHDTAKEHKDGKDAKGAKADAGPKKPNPLKAFIGPILAVVVLIGAGVGIGMFLAGVVKPKVTPAVEGKAEDAHGEAAKGEDAHGAAAGEHEESLIHHGVEMTINDLVTNVRDQGGKKFVAVTPTFWMTKECAKEAGLIGGGGHGGGGEVGGEIKRIIRGRLEENLRDYDMDELTSKPIYKKLEKSFRDIVEKEMHAVFPKLPDKPVVLRVVLNGLKVQ